MTRSADWGTRREAIESVLKHQRKEGWFKTDIGKLSASQPEPWNRTAEYQCG